LTTRSRSWTHLMKTATKIPHWSCSCCAITSLCGPVTRRATGTSHRRAATTNLPKLKSFLNLIRTSYSLSSRPRPLEVLTHMSIHPDPSIHPCPPDLSSLAYLVSFFPSFLPSNRRPLFPLNHSPFQKTDPSLFFSLFLSLFILTWPHIATNATATAAMSGSKNSNVREHPNYSLVLDRVYSLMMAR